MKWRGKGIEVLLVEDSPDDYELTRNVLESNAIKYHHAKDGEEAINFVTSALDKNNMMEIHLILLDLKLPKLNGFEVLKRIRSDKRSHNIPVVILSSTDDEREITVAYDLGANSFVIKPIEFEKFVRILSSIINYWIIVNEMSAN